jgi:F0F1-type ATP synthase membrane subunit a
LEDLLVLNIDPIINPKSGNNPLLPPYAWLEVIIQNISVSLKLGGNMNFLNF